MSRISDLISRQAAIDEVINLWADKPFGNPALVEIKDCIEKLPSEQSERKKGKWIQNDNGTYSCNLCQSWIPEEQYYYARFCLYCGAGMRCEQDG